MNGILRIIPLGGLGEVGKNMTVYELGDDASSSTPGSRSRATSTSASTSCCPTSRTSTTGRVEAVVLTHGHEDHVGALPYVLREVEVGEVIATRLTLGLIKSKLDEHGLGAATELREADPAQRRSSSARSGSSSSAWRTRSPTASRSSLETPAGRVVHTGDWKLDHTPVDGLKTDVGRLAALGNEGVDLMLGDSTNAERPGMTGSERLVGEAFRQIIPLRHGADPRRLVRVEHPPHAAGGRRRRRRTAARSPSSAARCART